MDSLATLAKLHEARVRDAMDALAATETRYELELKDLTGPGIEAGYSVTTVPLVIPRQIDLQAAASV